MAKPVVAAIDGNWILNRAYHVVDVNDPNVQGRLNYLVTAMMCKDALALRAKHMIVAWDGDSVFRHTLTSRYKANRRGGSKDKKDGTEGSSGKGEPNPVYQYLPALQEYQAKAGMPWVQLKTFEADDILAACANLGDEGYRVYLVTKDKDAFQLLNRNVSLYVADRKVDGKPKPLVFTDKMAEEAKGVPCSRMVDYQTLIGDSVDNITGLPNIGPAAARRIVLRFPTLKAWIASLEGDELAEVNAQRERIKLNRKLVTLDRKCWTPDVSTMTLPKRKLEGYPKSYAAYVDFLYPKSRGLFG